MGIKAAPIDLSKWCGYIVKVGHITAALIVLAHVVWYFAARSILAWPPDVYLRNYIILPAIGFLVINTVVDICVRSARFPLPAKEYLSLSLFIIFSLYLTMTHDLSKVLLCSYIFPIFASTIFSNVKLTRRIALLSVIAVLLPGVKIYLTGNLIGNMPMEIFVACFIFLCSYLLAEVLIKFSQENLTAMISFNEKATRNELAFLQAQIKPHFIYNAINTIVSFCYTDSERAANLLVNFSKYLRYIFDVDNKSMLVPLAREVDSIKTCVEIEKARFGERINVEYDIEPELLDMEIPSFCLQPFVENAIKHGLCKKDIGGTIRISAKKSRGTVIISVSDTGIGMSEEKLNQLRNSEYANDGVGFFNASRRIRGWKGAQLDIQSEEGKGTIVTIVIPESIA